MLIYIKVRELTECTLLTNCVKIELPGDSRGLQKPDRKQKEVRPGVEWSNLRGMRSSRRFRLAPLSAYEYPSSNADG